MRSTDRSAPGRGLAETILAEFRDSMRHVRCAAAERLVKQGISMTHLHVLWLLDEHGEMAMSRVADLLGVSLSNATGLVDRMEERDLVERVRLTDDRRVVHVRPTDHGREALREIDVLKADLIERVLGRLDEVQLERLALAIADVRAALAAEPGFGAPPAGCHHGSAATPAQPPTEEHARR